MALQVVRSCACGCLDACEHGPVVAQEPEHLLYGGVGLGDVEEILDAIAEGTVVKRLLFAGGSERGQGH